MSSCDNSCFLPGPVARRTRVINDLLIQCRWGNWRFTYVCNTPCRQAALFMEAQSACVCMLGWHRQNFLGHNRCTTMPLPSKCSSTKAVCDNSVVRVMCACANAGYLLLTSVGHWTLSSEHVYLAVDKPTSENRLYCYNIVKSLHLKSTAAHQQGSICIYPPATKCKEGSWCCAQLWKTNTERAETQNASFFW